MIHHQCVLSELQKKTRAFVSPKKPESKERDRHLRACIGLEEAGLKRRNLRSFPMIKWEKLGSHNCCTTIIATWFRWIPQLAIFFSGDILKAAKSSALWCFALPRAYASGKRPLEASSWIDPRRTAEALGYRRSTVMHQFRRQLHFLSSLSSNRGELANRRVCSMWEWWQLQRSDSGQWGWGRIRPIHNSAPKEQMANPRRSSPAELDMPTNLLL